jgi:hypothetical protein
MLKWKSKTNYYLNSLCIIYLRCLITTMVRSTFFLLTWKPSSDIHKIQKYQNSNKCGLPQQQFRSFILLLHGKTLHSNFLLNIIVVTNITQQGLILVSISHRTKYFHLLISSNNIEKLNNSHWNSIH